MNDASAQVAEHYIKQSLPVVTVDKPKMYAAFWSVTIRRGFQGVGALSMIRVADCMVSGLVSCVVMCLTGVSMQTANAQEYPSRTSLSSRQVSDVRVKFQHAIDLVDKNESNNALVVFSALTVDHPHLPEPHVNLAALYAQRGELAKARNSLRAVFDTHPSYATAYKNLEAVHAEIAARVYDETLAIEHEGGATPSARLVLMADLYSLGPLPERKPTPVVRLASTAPILGDSLDETAQISPAPNLPSRSLLKAEIIDTVISWTKAWSARDADGYLSFYGESFAPPSGLLREAWASERRRRITQPRFIKVSFRNPSIELQAEDRARATFLQIYRSDGFRGRTRKTLWLTKEANDWRIVREATEP